MKTLCAYNNLYANIAGGFFFIIERNWKQLKCLSTEDWLDNQIVVYPYHRANHSAREGNRPLTYAAMQINPTSSMLSKARHTRWHTAGFRPHDILEKAKQWWQGQMGDCQGLGAEGWGGDQFQRGTGNTKVTEVFYILIIVAVMLLYTHLSKLIKLCT